MKVKIGPYPTHYSFYRILSDYNFLKLSEEKIDFISDYLSETFAQKILDFYNNSRKRKFSVRIDNYDIWDFKSTLSPIILPMLKKMKETKDGAPNVSDDDVPDNIKCINAKPYAQYDVDEFWFDRWNYVLDEMIYAFEMTVIDWEEFCYKDAKLDKEKYDAIDKRIQNGFCLFGKYFTCLWN